MKGQTREFPKARRLLKRKDFQWVFKKGRRIDTDQFTIVIRKNQLGFSRLGISVNKDVGSAVIRNRVKRHIREAFRNHLGLREQSADFVFVVRGNRLNINDCSIQYEIEHIIKKL